MFFPLRSFVDSCECLADEEKQLNAVFGALADPTRRAMLRRISKGRACVTDLARPFQMSLPAVSKHLRVLENARILARERRGRVHQFRLESKPLHQAHQWIDRYREFWEDSLDSLADYLEKETKHIKRKGK